jgi:hypothetical protein
MRESAQAPKVAKYLNSSFAWFVHRYAGWYLNDSYGFVNADGQWQLKGKNVTDIRLLIIARKHYKEFVKYYPVTNLKELKQVLAEEYSDTTDVFHLIGNEIDNQRQVCSFVIDAQVFELFPAAVAFIPESVLLWTIMRSDQNIVEVQHSSPYFLYCKGALPVSQLKLQLCPDLYSFILNNGLPEGLAYKQISSVSHIDLLMQALAKTLLSDWKHVFFKAPELKSLKFDLKQLAIAAAGIGMTYMLLSSAYLSLMLSHQEQKLASLGADIEVLLQLQEKLETTHNEFVTIEQSRATQFHSAHLWQVVLDIKEADTNIKIQAMSSQGNTHIIRGTASRATSVLTTLQSSDLVRSARFDAPVRREGNKELFVIALELKQDPVVAGVPDAK